MDKMIMFFFYTVFCMVCLLKFKNEVSVLSNLILHPIFSVLCLDAEGMALPIIGIMIVLLYLNINELYNYWREKI